MSVTAQRSPILLAPAQVLRGWGALSEAGSAIARVGQRPLVVGGDRARALVQDSLTAIASEQSLTLGWGSSLPDCSEAVLARLQQAATEHQADCILGVGGGKALDTAKLLGHQLSLPVITVPTSAATCAAWTALANVYTDAGAWLYDVGLDRCPELLILDFELIAQAPPRTLAAGIGDAIAKWYEASVSSGHRQETLVVAAVQQARVLRDLLFQKSAAAIAEPGGEQWYEVVEATVLLAGVIGGLGGAQCRTVAAHAVHNGLTHLPACHDWLHGEKVAFGILVQLRLEELQGTNPLAATARQQLLSFYADLGLPRQWSDMGLASVSLADLQQAAILACAPESDIHHLPFAVDPDQLLAAMVSTTTPIARSNSVVAE
ncbi:iron-containing alcohol dehydrogenase family protein [Synechococcus elongatus]|uniref:iron-containing alcohol dehydrogenase family protein n=1 Tax=Synechococcus elongatus TaxID=32046 RepID=UPI000A46DF1C|nr:iron-containing alcohol dehydrogenase family protein [Synechococcus elongatus]WKW05266.1 iron-containing alcohol dehydrogenase family protein [Synechococcus elongatus PCC 7942 = FACHB-805]